MINLAKKIIKFYIELNQEPTLEDLEVSDPIFTNEKGTLFVTLYKNGEIIGSCGNFLEIEKTKGDELIKACIGALNDSRFVGIKKDYDDIKIRIDEIIKKEVVKDKKVSDFIPHKNGIIVIKKDYDDLAILLPGISPNINTGEDMISVLNKKLKNKFIEDDYIIYEIETKKITDF